MRMRTGALVFFLLVTIGISGAQTKKPTTTPKVSADVAAQREFAACLAEFKAQPGDPELRDKVVRLARALKTAPAIPLDARDYFSQGMAQFQRAATVEEFKSAAGLFGYATQTAPWYAEAYYDMAAAYAKAGDYEKEKQSLREYIKVARDASGIEAAQNRIREADVKQAQAEFTKALADLKANPSDAAQRERIVQRASLFNPPLPVPEEAERYLARGKAAFDDAKEPNDFKDAVIQFERARDAAPWYGPIYYSLGVAQSTAGYHKAAKANLSIYLAWTHDPAEIKSTKEMIYQVEYKQEKAQAELDRINAAEAAERSKAQSRQALISGLNGSWHCQSDCSGATVTVNVDGSFSVRLNTGATLSGTFKDFAVEGIATYPGYRDSESNCNVPTNSHNFTGTVDEWGTRIVIRTERNDYAQNWNLGSLFVAATCTNISLRQTDPIEYTLFRTGAGQQSTTPSPAPTNRRKR